MLVRRAVQGISKLVLAAPCRSTIQPFQHLRRVQSLTQQRIPASEDSLESRLDGQGPRAPADDILKNADYFEVEKLFTVKEMFHSGVHLGHMTGTLDDRMRQFIFGQRFNQLIFDLDKTADFLREALNFISHISYRGGIILFITRDRQNAHLVEQTAIDCGEYAHTRYWKGGVLSNSVSFFGSVTRLPDTIIFLSTMNSVLEQHIAVEQAALMNIPTVGIVDTNCNPNMISYPVPGNDDSPSACSFYCHIFKNAILNAKKRKIEDDARAQQTAT